MSKTIKTKLFTVSTLSTDSDVIKLDCIENLEIQPEECETLESAKETMQIIAKIAADQSEYILGLLSESEELTKAFDEYIATVENLEGYYDCLLHVAPAVIKEAGELLVPTSVQQYNVIYIAKAISEQETIKVVKESLEKDADSIAIDMVPQLKAFPVEYLMKLAKVFANNPDEAYTTFKEIIEKANNRVRSFSSNNPLFIASEEAFNTIKEKISAFVEKYAFLGAVSTIISCVNRIVMKAFGMAIKVLSKVASFLIQGTTALALCISRLVRNITVTTFKETKAFACFLASSIKMNFVTPVVSALAKAKAEKTATEQPTAKTDSKEETVDAFTVDPSTVVLN